MNTGGKALAVLRRELPGVNAEEPETTITLEEIAELGLEFEKELEETGMDGFVEFLKQG